MLSFLVSCSCVCDGLLLFPAISEKSIVSGVILSESPLIYLFLFCPPRTSNSVEMQLSVLSGNIVADIESIV